MEATSILVQFQNGSLNDKGIKSVSSINLEEDRVNVKLNSKDEYSGNVDSSTNDYLLICRKRTNKMEIVKVKKVLLQHSTLSTITPEVELNVQTNVQTPQDKFADLQRAFGGKKGIRRVEQRERYKLDVSGSSVKEKLEETAKSISKLDPEQIKSEDSQIKDSLLDLLPPCHRDTKNIYELYVLEEIFSEDLLKIAAQAASEIIETVDLSNTPFVQHCWQEAQKPSRIDSDHALGAAFIIIAIAQMLRVKARECSKKSFKCSSSSVVHDYVMKTFCTVTEKTVYRSTFQRDRALCHVIAVAFILCDYKIPLNLLANDVEVTFSILQRLCRAVGGVISAKGSFEFRLRLPLPPLPSESKSKSAKSKKLF